MRGGGDPIALRPDLLGLRGINRQRSALRYSSAASRHVDIHEHHAAGFFRGRSRGGCADAGRPFLPRGSRDEDCSPISHHGDGFLHQLCAPAVHDQDYDHDHLALRDRRPDLAGGDPVAPGPGTGGAEAAEPDTTESHGPGMR